MSRNNILLKKREEEEGGRRRWQGDGGERRRRTLYSGKKKKKESFRNVTQFLPWIHIFHVWGFLPLLEKSFLEVPQILREEKRSYPGWPPFLPLLRLHRSPSVLICQASSSHLRWLDTLHLNRHSFFTFMYLQGNLVLNPYILHSKTDKLYPEKEEGLQLTRKILWSRPKPNPVAISWAVSGGQSGLWREA